MESKKLLTMNELYMMAYTKSIRQDYYRDWMPVSKQDEDLQMLYCKFEYLFKQNGMDTDQNFTQFFELKSIAQNRAIACLLGLGIADALGATTQFLPFERDRAPLIEKGFKEIPSKVNNETLNRRGRVGVWTDDCSMALCLADSLLFNNFKFNPQDLRLRFMLWIRCGMNNGGRPHSIGLGGNIAVSMEQFWKNPEKPYAQKGDEFNNGNGSLMRMAPAVTAFINDKAQAIKVSEEQSWTTHNGKEASQCCKLFAEILHSLINRPKDQEPKALIVKVCDQFKTPLKSVECLAKGQIESEEEFKKACEANQKFKKFNKSVEGDRNWQWRTKDFTYSTTRAKLQPEYIGSYCMDALGMALFICMHTNSYEEAVLYAANMGGDSDTVGAIAGQIAGAMYGLTKGMLNLYSEMPDSIENRFHLFIVAKKLARQEALTLGNPKKK